MRWTLWLILMVLLGIFQEVSGKTAEEAGEVILFCMILSGITLFKDYLNKRKEK